MSGTLKEFEAEQAQAGNPPAAETTPPAEGQPAVKEATVIIEGKERPLKNYEAELTRKHNEEIERIRQEYEQRFVQNQPQPQQPPQQTNWLDQIYQQAEMEIASTGKAVPLQTIMQVSNALSQRNIESHFKTKDEADKSVRSFKRSIRKEPDFAEVEDDFDALVDQLQPSQINAPTLEVILNSVRGRKAKDLISKARLEGKKDAEKDSQILGAPAESTSGGTPPKTSLTPEQQKELDFHNRDTTMEWTPDEYKKALEQKVNRFKASGAKNIPQLLSDQMIR